MGKDEYQILGYEEMERWYAIVLHICNERPIYVYYVPSDDPTPPKEEDI